MPIKVKKGAEFSHFAREGKSEQTGKSLGSSTRI
jgi:hypothetical protein